MSRAIREAGDWKYQAMACAALDAASAIIPAKAEKSFDPFM
jgi:hypothetical protein